jgi:hypothetical protein
MANAPLEHEYLDCMWKVYEQCEQMPKPCCLLEKVPPSVTRVQMWHFPQLCLTCKRWWVRRQPCTRSPHPFPLRPLRHICRVSLHRLMHMWCSGVVLLVPSVRVCPPPTVTFLSLRQNEHLPSPPT